MAAETLNGEEVMVRGDSFIRKAVVTDRGNNDAVVDLDGASIWVTGKRKITDTDANAIFQKTIGDGVTVTDSDNGEFQLELDPTDTSTIADNLFRYGVLELFFDIQAKQSSGRIHTVWRGKLKIYQDTSRDTS